MIMIMTMQSMIMIMTMQSMIMTTPTPCGHLSGADWLRAWPFGLVHYSEDWSARLDSRFDTVCGRSPYYWPSAEWPEQAVCPDCRLWVERHQAHAHMLYASEWADA